MIERNYPKQSLALFSACEFVLVRGFRGSLCGMRTEYGGGEGCRQSRRVGAAHEERGARALAVGDEGAQSRISCTGLAQATAALKVANEGAPDLAEGGGVWASARTAGDSVRKGGIVLIATAFMWPRPMSRRRNVNTGASASEDKESIGEADEVAFPPASPY